MTKEYSDESFKFSVLREPNWDPKFLKFSIVNPPIVVIDQSKVLLFLFIFLLRLYHLFKQLKTSQTSDSIIFSVILSANYDELCIICADSTLGEDD